MLNRLHTWILIAAAALGACAPNASGPTVLLISFDGFRWDYLDKAETPAFDALAARGIRVRELIPAFPTETFPNHYTIVTGLYPANHGVVSNTMYDPEYDATFRIGVNAENRNPRWWGGEPIWLTAKRQGLRTAAFFWTGTDVAIDGEYPDEWRAFDPGTSSEERVDQVVAWLTRPADQRPHLVTTYFSLTDQAGHDHGPDAPETIAAIRQSDSLLGAMLDGLERGGTLDEINVIVVSDHGMAARNRERVVFLDDYIALDEVRVVTWTPLLSIIPTTGDRDSLVAALQDAPHLRVYRREDTPAAWQYRDHRRIPPIVGVADVGWVVTSRDYYESNPDRPSGGTHGWDPSAREMRSPLVAAGPDLVRGAVRDSLENIHLYELMCALLGIEPAPNDGSLAAVRDLLR